VQIVSIRDGSTLSRVRQEIVPLQVFASIEDSCASGFFNQICDSRYFYQQQNNQHNLQCCHPFSSSQQSVPKSELLIPLLLAVYKQCAPDDFQLREALLKNVQLKTKTINVEALQKNLKIFVTNFMQTHPDKRY